MKYTVKYNGGCPGDTWEDQTEIEADSIMDAAMGASDIEADGVSKNDCDYDTRVISIEEIQNTIMYRPTTNNNQ